MRFAYRVGGARGNKRSTPAVLDGGTTRRTTSSPLEHRMSNYITDDHSDDGVDRRGFLKCMAWAGTGMLWAISGGIPTSTALGRGLDVGAEVAKGDLFFVQISDSHIGFNKAANQDVTAT